MLPFLAERFGNPSGRARRSPATPGAPLDEARDVVADVPRLRARRGRVHQRRHRGRQPRRARRRAPATARSCARAVEHHAVLAPGRGRRRPRRRRRPPTASSTSTRWPPASTTTVAVVSVMLANNEVGTIQPLDRGRRGRARARAAAPCCTPTPSRPSRGSTSAAPRRAGRPGRRSAPTSSAGPRASARWSSATARRSPPLLLGGGQERERRSGTQNVAGVVGDGRRRCGRPSTSASAVVDRVARRCATAWPTASLGAVDRRRRDRRPRAPQGRRQLPRAASPASRARRCCSCSTQAGVLRVGGVVVRQRRAGAVARAGRHGRRRATRARGLAAAVARLDHHRRRHRPAARRRAAPRRRRACGSAGVVRVLVAMSGGVDSSVAAALLLDAGHDVVGVTLKLWGGESRHRLLLGGRRRRRPPGRRSSSASTTTSSTSATTFDAHVVAPYVADHAAGRTPNPCIECNRHLKFDRLLRRADALGFDAVATGHHARVVERRRRHAAGRPRRRPRQGPELRALHARPGRAGPHAASRSATCTKAEVRAGRRALGLRTATKPDSQDVCFITATGGRAGVPRATASRCTPGRGRRRRRAAPSARVDAVELVTVGQRRGLGLAGGGTRPATWSTSTWPPRTVTVGPDDELLAPTVTLDAWRGRTSPSPAGSSPSAAPTARATPPTSTRRPTSLTWAEPQRRVAPGQSVVLYDGDEVVGAGLAAPAH